MAKKKEVERPLTHRIPESRYFLAQLVVNFRTEDSHLDYSFERNSTEPVFRILDVLDGPEIPDGLAAGEYFVIKTVRKFKITACIPETIYATKELKL
jgi:hypothetical protein